MKFEEILSLYLETRWFERCHIPLLARYLILLQKWNRRYNLTSIVDAKEMVIKHILDSLAIRPFIVGQRIIDVGSGAGLPGIPLAITLPEKQFVLLDSRGKKTRFLTQVKIDLELKNVDIIGERCEKYHPAHCFDVVVARAFSNLSEMLKCTQHLVCQSGIFLAMKGVFPWEELNAIPNGFAVERIEPLHIPNLLAKRHVILMAKKSRLEN